MRLFRTTPGLSVAAAVLALVADLSAQTETSPRGYLQKEGNFSFQALGYYNQALPYATTLAQVDDTLRGTPRQISTLFLRRDGQLATNGSYSARTLRLTLRLGQADYAKIRPNFRQPDSEYLVGDWVRAIDRDVALPDLSVKPASSTAPFNVRLPLDAPFSFPGTHALALQLRAGPSSLPYSSQPYPVDAVYLQVTSSSLGVEIGTGCVATGRSEPMAHWLYITSYGAKGLSKLAIATSEAPADAAVLQLLGTTNPDLAFGACARLWCSPLLTLVTPVGQNGMTEFFLQFPHDDALVGLVLYSQSVAFDAGQPGLPFVLSNGYKSTYPKNPAHGVECAMAGGVQAVQAPWPSFAFGRGSGVVIGLD